MNEQENEYVSIKITRDTKEQFDKMRTLPQGTVSADEFVQYLLKVAKKAEKEKVN